MGRRRLFWQLFPAFVAITTLSLIAVSALTAHVVRTSFRDRAVTDMRHDVGEIGIDFEVWFPAAAPSAERDAACRDQSRRLGARLTIIAPDGTVLGDSDGDSAALENHADRAEVQAALAGRSSTAIRESRTLGHDLIYYAEPLVRGGETVAVLRLAVSAVFVDAELAAIRERITLSALAVALLAAAVSLWISRRLSRPLEQLRRSAELYAAGDLEHRLPPAETSEIDQLAEAMNAMAAQLDERIRAAERQRDELEAVFAGMVEGVLLIDARQRIVSLNQAGADLLGVPREGAAGRTVPEALRHAALQRFIERTAGEAAAAACEADLELPGTDGGTVHLRVHGVRLERPGEPPRTLVVMHDVTRMRKLENVRQEFVANVSHELKTPVTSIKGFVETLRDGALDHPADARRFLDIVARQADRLQAIIEDLLCLSRLEQGTGQTSREMGVYPVAGVLAAAVQTCQPHADARGALLVVTCEPGLRAHLDPPLLEQALVNLIENAIKYNEEGTRVTVSAREDGDVVRIVVADDGRGIEARHLPRLFERFYREDRARSRQEGGTGLGLAIVKHIALFHGGEVDVRSTPGGGSEFTLTLPSRPAAVRPG
ncbi:MAG: ATP-binding protein [Candidatus Latescibacteria bacterium]|nr:ATP-binding protein [Candidatus Latescibacterota bacterium]